MYLKNSKSIKLTLLIILLGLSQINGQYWQERTTEQSFEQSSLYFTSHYLNTFGLQSFKKVAVGLINDPFLNLQLNPANLPDLKSKDMLIYLDFRGDRTESELVSTFAVPAYYDYSFSRYPPIDRRWFSVTRAEKEPIFSLGILSYPVSDVSRDIFIGGTYQFIYNEEKYYQVPYWIYNSNYYYDSFGLRAEGTGDIPIEDRYSGKDEMNTEGHLFSLFAGYNFSDKLTFGASINGVIHDRDGAYIQTSKDEFGQNNNTDWSNSNSQTRNQSYNHIDLSGGIKYLVTPKFSLGLKLGLLTGEADQDDNSASNHNYSYNDPMIDQEWNINFSRASSAQKWNQDGNTKYARLTFERRIDDKKSVRGFYKYSYSDIDISNSSNINDTSYYRSRWVYNNEWRRHNSTSATHDNRTGSGTKNKYVHEGMINTSWSVTPVTTINIGVFFQSNKSVTKSIDGPVSVSRFSEYSSTGTDGYNYSNYYSQIEDKSLEWNYKSNYFTLQIPILMEFRTSDKFGLKLGINRILERWKITDQTLAIFDRRLKNENYVITEENNFGERYTQPDEKITEDRTDVIFGANLYISKDFKVNFLIDPEFDDFIRIAQWWLSFEASL